MIEPKIAHEAYSDLLLAPSTFATRPLVRLGKFHVQAMHDLFCDVANLARKRSTVSLQ